MKTKSEVIPCWIVRAADGDTVIVLLELGWGIWREISVRLVGIDSWELDSPNAADARRARLMIDTRYAMTRAHYRADPRGVDKYGRARGWIVTGTGDLATELVRWGIAWPTDRAEYLDRRPPEAIESQS